MKRPIRLLSAEPALREQTEYNSRRLAKLGIPAETVLRALDGRMPDAEQREIATILNRGYSEVREEESAALEELFWAEVTSRTLGETLEGFAAALRTYAKADFVEFRFPCDVPLPLRRAICFEVKTRDRRLLDKSWNAATVWSVPLGEQGVMQLGFRKRYPWLRREREVLEIAAMRSLAAAEKARLMEQLASSERQVRALAARMLETEEIERRRISRELHDEAGQSLLCMRLNLEMLEHALGDSEAVAKVRETREMAERTVREIRRILSALNPEVLERLGLAAAIRQLGTRLRDVCPARMEFDIGVLPALPPKRELLVYRLAQECVHNAARHSQAKNLKVSLHVVDAVIRLRMSDDGIGFRIDEALARPGSYGISGMKERVALLGGSITIDSRPDGKKRRGTTIEIELPIGQENAADSYPSR